MKKLRTFLIGLFFVLMTSPASAGFPTIEIGPELIQTIIQRIQQAQQLYEEIEARKTQNKQFQMELQDFAGPQNAAIWSQPSDNIRQMVANVNNLNSLRDYVSTLQQLLETYKSYKEYSRTPCFSEGPCDENDRQQLSKMIDQANAMNSDLSRSSTNGMVMLLDRQKMTLQSDANKLQRLERNATTPQGRNEALAYANQFASAQANQLMQMRALMVAQQNVVVMKMKADQDEADKRKAADAQLTKFRPAKQRQSQHDILKTTDRAKPE